MQEARVPARPVRLADVILACNLGMFLLGTASTLYGPILVYLAAESHQSLARLGSIFILHWAGFFASTVSANRLARRLEMRWAMIVDALLVGVGMLGLAGLPFPYNLGAALVVGFGAGMLEILLNRLVEILAENEPAAALSRLHAAWGMGAITIPLVVVAVAQAGLGWRAAGVVVALLAALFIAAALRWPEFAVDHGDASSRPGFPWQRAAIFALIFVVYVGLESAVAGWAATFFARLGEGPVIGALATSLFFLTFSIGRLFFASGIERLGYTRSVQLATGLGGVALLLTWVPGVELLGFALAGLAYSIVFPTLIVWAARRHPEWRAQLTGLAIASGGVGGLLIPYVIGLGVDAFGARTLSPMLVITSAIVFGLTLLIQ